MILEQEHTEKWNRIGYPETKSCVCIYLAYDDSQYLLSTYYVLGAVLGILYYSFDSQNSV